MADATAPNRAPGRPQRVAPRIFAARVARVADVTAHLRRITVAAPELASYAPLGCNEYVGLVLPRSADAPLVLPDAASPSAIRTAVAAIDEHIRPDLRWYTVRDHRPAAGELDIDFVVHGDEGPGTRFALRARPGDALGIRECTALYNPPENARTRVLIGDESSLPASARILELTPDLPRPHVFAEVADARDRDYLPGPITWVARSGAPGEALEAAVRAADLPPQIDYVWLCGERRGVQQLRRHFTRERAVPKDRITFSGYWRLGEVRG